MKTIKFFSLTIQKVLHQPAIIFLLLLEFAALSLLLFGVHCEFDRDLLVSISLLGKPLEADYMLHVMINSSLYMLWNIILILFVLGTAAMFAEFFSDSLLPIYLTKNISRTKLLFISYINIVVMVTIIQILFSGLLMTILYFKTAELYWNVGIFFLFGPAIQIALLVALSATTAVIFEKHSVSFIVVLVALFLQPYLYEGYAYVSTALKICITLFPPVEQINKYSMSLIKDVHGSTFPFTVFLYIALYLGAAIIVFQKKDIS